MKRAKTEHSRDEMEKGDGDKISLGTLFEPLGVAYSWTFQLQELTILFCKSDLFFSFSLQQKEPSFTE